MNGVDKTQAKRLLREMIHEINETHQHTVIQTMEMLKSYPDFTLRVEPILRPLKIKDIVTEEIGRDYEMD